jgi:hypothetical protein
MPAQWLQFLFEDNATPNTGKNYGPYNVDPINKLFEVEVRGGIGYENSVFGDASQYSNYVVWGVQWGPHGFTPAAIDAASNNPNVLISEVVETGNTTLAVNPTTDTAAVLIVANLSLTWRGQLFIGENTDLYFQAASFVTPPEGWGLYGSLNIRFV